MSIVILYTGDRVVLTDKPTKCRICLIDYIPTFASRPKPILPLFSFVPVRHKGLEDLGRVIILFFVSITLFVEIMSRTSNCFYNLNQTFGFSIHDIT